jgi:hypothetical protein
MKKRLYSYFLACVPLIAHGAQSENAVRLDLSFTGQPQSYIITGTPYRAQGFGEARFGMTVNAVKHVLAASYPGPAAAVKDDIDVLTRNRSLTVVLPHLDPGPGPATISYVFGAKCACLVAVNIYWLATGTASPVQQAALTAAAGTLAAGLVGHQWPPLSSARGHVLPGNSLVVFSGKDQQGGGVEVRLDGVTIDIEPRTVGPAQSRAEHRVPADGPAQLRLSIVANVDHPDVYRIAPNAF